MIVTLGEKGLNKTWQAPFPKIVECPKCKGEARIAFVAHEHLDGEKPEEYVFQLHPNEGKGGFWWHDTCAVAVYLCRDCFNPVAKTNQG